MSYNVQTGIALSFQTGADLSQAQGLFVKIGTDSLLTAADKTDYALGVLVNQPSVGVKGQYAGTVAILGVAPVCVGGVYPIGTFIVPGVLDSTHGIGLSVADATANARYVRAVTLQASTAAYDVVSCRLIDANPGVDSTVVA